MQLSELNAAVSRIRAEHAAFVDHFEQIDKYVLSPAFENIVWEDQAAAEMTNLLNRMRVLIGETQMIADRMHRTLTRLTDYEDTQFEMTETIDFRTHKD